MCATLSHPLGITHTTGALALTGPETDGYRKGSSELILVMSAFCTLKLCRPSLLRDLTPLCGGHRELGLHDKYTQEEKLLCAALATGRGTRHPEHGADQKQQDRGPPGR